MIYWNWMKLESRRACYSCLFVSMPYTGFRRIAHKYACDIHVASIFSSFLSTEQNVATGRIWTAHTLLSWSQGQRASKGNAVLNHPLEKISVSESNSRSVLCLCFCSTEIYRMLTPWNINLVWPSIKIVGWEAQEADTSRDWWCPEKRHWSQATSANHV